jgi:lipopolysaccharide transport system ATP-binding protein
LALQALSSEQIREKEKEIVEFAELYEFIDQPLKTYSTGMQARLAFSTATAVEPELLIIDEVLGAGDAYFAGKCIGRMRKITEHSGATVLFVSHDLNSVQRLCNHTIWLDRGRIVMKGDSLDVIKAYTKFIQNIENTRLQAKNRKRFSNKYGYEHMDAYTEALVITFQLQGENNARCDIAEISLLRDGRIEETLKVGDTQDTSFNHPSILVSQGGQWSEPLRFEEGYYRSLVKAPGTSKMVKGQALFYIYYLFDESNYEFRIRLRCINPSQMSAVISRNGNPIKESHALKIAGRNWTCWTIKLDDLTNKNRESLDNESPIDKHPDFGREKTTHFNGPRIAKWSGEGSLVIEKVIIIGPDGNEQSIFEAGSSLTLSITFSAQSTGTYEIIPVAVLFTIDGIIVSNNPGPMTTVNMKVSDKEEFRLHFDKLNLGDGDYVFSVALYRELSSFTQAVFYDLIDRSYQFRVIDNPPFNNGIFKHPGKWILRKNETNCG